MSCSWLGLIIGGLLLQSLCVAGAEPENPAAMARLTVDSTFRGYGTQVLTDGKWVVVGQESTHDTGSPDRLGNCGNTWVSAAVEGAEHWVRLDWGAPVACNQVTVWWPAPEWYPRAFRVEYLSDTNWVAPDGPDVWFEPTAQCSVLTFAPMPVRALRIVQHPAGGTERGFLALQEVQVGLQPEAERGPVGARKLTAEALHALMPAPLEPNLARLHERQPGASVALSWNAAGAPFPAPALSDGDTLAAVHLAPDAMPGIQWPIQHVSDGAAVFSAEARPRPPVVEIHDGVGWVRLPCQSTPAQNAPGCLRLSWEPVATTAVRLVQPEDSPPLTEFEVHRYLPTGPHVWPERLVADNAYEKELLASGVEPSYEALCTAALSMTPAHALLGLKDIHPETGVTWDGALISKYPLRFSFGAQGDGLAACRDTVTRRLLDNWRPATVVSGRLGDLGVTETAFVGFAGPDRARPALFCRLELTNLGADGLDTSATVSVSGGATVPDVAAGVVAVGDRLALVGPGGSGAGSEPGTLTVALSLPPGGQTHLDFVQPHGAPPPVTDTAQYRTTSYETALREFRAYWDDILRPAERVQLPEARLLDMRRAILAQLFINADGDIMPYGSDPGAYSGNLYGVEESFAMMALAQAGYQADTQRYLDGTYLTPEFLVKVDEYAKYADRHQQYRNGLQPHYAVSTYRLGRDRVWIEKHLPLLRECAEWTIAQRRETMVLENGEKPLHWGLLPKWSYGGDISELQCYGLYANFACWKGLVDTAWLLGELGDADTAERYLAEAADYRLCIDRAVEGNYRPDHQPPFLPLQLYAKDPVGNDYDQLFYGMLLDLMPWPADHPQLRYLTDFLEQDNRLFCLMPRFRRDVGAGGLDGLYGLGYMLSTLHQGRVPEFLLGFYGYLAFNLERDTYAARETNLIYAGDLHARSKYKVPDMSDPVPCSAAVALLYMRHMLVTEVPPREGVPSGELRLLAGAPRAWFRDGREIALDRMPTEYGEVSLRVHSEVAHNRIEATVTPPTRDSWQLLRLRLPHPEGKAWQQVLVNDRAQPESENSADWVDLAPGANSYHVVVEY